LKLIFIRHGIADGHFLKKEKLDFERSLTMEGISEFKSSMKKLKKLEPKINVIFSSPLLRAVQSAEILWSYYQDSNLELLSDLDILDDPNHLIHDISFLPPEGTYAFIGHDPHLTKVITSLLALHPEHDFMKIKKGGVCILKGGAWEGFRLVSLITPKILSSK
jgi:phosphohistidine phosphatase